MIGENMATLKEAMEMEVKRQSSEYEEYEGEKKSTLSHENLMTAMTSLLIILLKQMGISPEVAGKADIPTMIPRPT